jgi:hypothetical protein
MLSAVNPEYLSSLVSGAKDKISQIKKNEEKDWVNKKD